MSRNPKKTHATFDRGSSNGRGDLFEFSMVFADVATPAVTFDTVGLPSRFSGYEFGFDAPSDAEVNDVWGEPEFDLTHYIVADQPDRIF